MVNCVRVGVVISGLAFACGCTEEPPSASAAHPAGTLRAAPVGSERLANADRDVNNWLTYGRTYSEQRFSSLAQINAQNVSQLKLAWHYNLPTDLRTHET